MCFCFLMVEVPLHLWLFEALAAACIELHLVTFYLVQLIIYALFLFFFAHSSALVAGKGYGKAFWCSNG